MGVHNLVSLLGVFLLMGVAWALSTDRRRVNIRCVGVGLALQLAVGLLVFATPGSAKLFLRLNDAVVALMDAATAGQKFVFGNLATPPGRTGSDGLASPGFILATQALPLMVFFSALMGLLYYVGVMQRVIRGFAWVFTRLMRVSGAESLCVAAEIFVGIESSTAVRPYLAQMTRSEFCTILTAGMATVASTTMGLYVVFLKDVIPTIAGHLISASLIAAPAAIIMSKLLVPETGEPVTLGRVVAFEYEREGSAIEAIINGAMAGVRLVVGVCALLIAFLGMLALLDAGLGWTGVRLGLIEAGQVQSPLSALLGWVMAPFALAMGVPPDDALFAGRLLGIRLIATEIPAYTQLAEAMKQGTIVHARSGVICAYALCGFAHVASLAIFTGGVAALVPQRRADLARIAPRALLAATLACPMTGAIAGVFCTAM